MKRIFKILTLLMVVSMIFATGSIMTNFDSQSFAAVKQKVKHKSSTAKGTAESTSDVGGYGGEVTCKYVIGGMIYFNGKPRVINNRVILKITKPMNYSSFQEWDPLEEPDLKKVLYDYDGEQGPKSSMWEKLVANTGVGTIEDWQKGRIMLASDDSLRVSVNISFKLTDSSKPSTLGDHKISNKTVDLSLLYNKETDKFEKSEDLIQAEKGKAVVNYKGNVMIAGSKMELFAGKHSTITFEDLVPEITMYKVQFFDQQTQGAGGYTFLKTIEVPEGGKIPTADVPKPTGKATYRNFHGWHLDTGGKGTQVIDKDNKVSGTVSKDLKLFAHYQVNVKEMICTDPKTANSKYSFRSKNEISKTLTYCGSYSPTAPPALKGYKFTGWYTEKEGGKKVTSSTSFTQHRKIYARYTQAQADAKLEYYVWESDKSQKYVLYDSTPIFKDKAIPKTCNIKAPSLGEPAVLKHDGKWYTKADRKTPVTFGTTVATAAVTKIYAGYIPGTDEDIDPNSPEDVNNPAVPGENIAPEEDNGKAWITWNYPESNWTNTPYTIISTLHISEEYRTSSGGCHLDLKNCHCHNHCDSRHTHSYCSLHNTLTGLHEAIRYKTILVPEAKLKVDMTSGGAIGKISFGDIKMVEKVIEEPYTYTCDGCATFTSDKPCGNTSQTATCTFNIGGYCGQTLYCRKYKHDGCKANRCSYTVPSFQWVWAKNPTIFPSGNKIELSGSVDSGSIYNSNNNYCREFTINQTGEWKTEAKYELEAQNTEPDYNTIPVPVEGKGQKWMLHDKPRVVFTSESGAYCFDNISPTITFDTEDYGMSGSHSNDTTKTGEWTSSDVTVNIQSEDYESGIDEGGSSIRLTGTKLLPNGSAVTINEHLGFQTDFSTTLTDSGVYTFIVTVKDNADQGDIPGARGTGNYTTVTYTVKVDKIAPIIKYSLIDDYFEYNNLKNRFETSPDLKPKFMIHASDNESGYPSSGLKFAKYGITDDKSKLSNAKIYATIKFADSNMAFGKYKEAPIPDELLKKGKDVYLVIYAEDNVGNSAYTVSELALSSDYALGTVNDKTKQDIGPQNNWEIVDDPTREIPTSTAFINRSNLYVDLPNVYKTSTNGSEVIPASVIRSPLEITKAYDVKWKTTLSREKPAISNSFAVYRNTLNDMIGLGYRVNFRYYQIGYGLDDGDITTVVYDYYGKKGLGYEKLDLYLTDDGGKTYQKAGDTSIYYKNAFKNEGIKASLTESEEDKVVVNSGVFVKAGENMTALYFNLNVPSLTKFKYKNTTGAYYTGSEILVRISLYSKKHMYQKGLNSLLHSFREEDIAPWGKNGSKKQFYGTSNTIDSLPKGQSVWFDVKNTAMKDIEGGKSY